MKALFSLLLPALVLLAVYFCALPAEAYWIGLSPNELVERADLIVIGEIKGVSGERQSEGGMWMTFWEVQVGYVLKGEADSAQLIVATPGACNKQPHISTYYRLNEWGNTVLLFLERREGRLEPPTPQGVVAMRRDKVTPLAQLTGECLMQQYTIIDNKTPEADKAELESYIRGLPRVVDPSSTGDTAKEGCRPAGRYIFPVALFAVAGLAAFILRWRGSSP